MTTPLANENQPVWEISLSHPQFLEPLKQHFSEVVDPEIGLNIIQLGLIRNVSLQDDKALVTMILTTPFCPYGPALLESARQKAEKALGYPVSIRLGSEVWDFSMMEEGTGFDWGMY